MDNRGSSHAATHAMAQRDGAGNGSGPAIAVLAGAYPLPSETFVYREVAALRARGWTVHTVGLHPSGGDPEEVTNSAEPPPLQVYGEQQRQTLTAALRESVVHPRRTIATVAAAVMDAIAPGEQMATVSRVKLVAQAICAVGLARRLRPLNATHLHCHFAHAPTTIGMYAARHLNVPFSMTGHANDIFHRRCLLRRKLERAAFVCCISQWHKRFYERICPRDGSAYRLVRCGVAVDDWCPNTGVPSNGRTHVVTVCRLVEKKGVDTLLRAFAAVSNNTPDSWRLTIVGDGPMRECLRELAGRLGCDQRIAWLGAVGNQQVHHLLADADIFALPCRTDRHQDRDGIPVVFMEAMACGLPTIAGDLEAIRELIEDERTGLLVPGHDQQAVQAALSRLAASPALRRELGMKGRERVKKEFSLDANIDRLTEAIEHAAVCRSRV